MVFTFERKEAIYAVYWHISADKRLEIPLKPETLVLMESLGTTMETVTGEQAHTTLVPIGKRRFLKAKGASRDELILTLKESCLLEA